MSSGVERRALSGGVWSVAAHKLRAMKYQLPTVIATSLGIPLVYMLTFGIGVSTVVELSAASSPIAGVDYLLFVTPALLCVIAVSAATQEFTLTVLNGFLWRPIFVVMAGSPLTPVQIASGICLYTGIRVLLASAAFYLVAVAFGGLALADILTVPVAVLTGLSFAAIGAYVATLKEERGHFAVIHRIILLPIMLLSGVYFPAETAPWPIPWVAWISPLWHGSELARSVAYDAVFSGPTALHLVFLVVATAAGWLLLVRAAARRLSE